MKKISLSATAIAALFIAPPVAAQVIVDEQFNYADQAGLVANWSPGSSPLTLNTTVGNPSPSVHNPGASSTTANIWRGSTFSLTPTDANPIVLSGDIISDGLAGSVTTIGLRTGANPLFEMGLYRLFDNVQTGPDTSAPLSPVGMGFGTRTINIGQDLNGQDWVKFGDIYTGTAHFEATFTTFGVTTRVDINDDGSWDAVFTETGTTPIGAFSDLRIHAPTPTATGTTGAIVDNVRLEVVPEPSTYALLGLGGVMFALLRRRK